MHSLQQFTAHTLALALVLLLQHQVSNYGAFDCFFRVLQHFPDCAVLMGSQRLAGKHQAESSMLFFSYHEMVHALK